MSSMGRYSEQKNKADSKSNVQSSLLEVLPLPTDFHFWNGDEYSGQSAIIKEKQMIAMEGRGVYKTSDGQTYEGIWENDFLQDDCRITFPDKSVFSGNLNEMMITGPGKYFFKEKIQIEGEFIGNNLTGNVFLKDPNHNYWRGKVDENEEMVNFYPCHPFWQSVLHLPTNSYSLFYGEAEEVDENFWENNY